MGVPQTLSEKAFDVCKKLQFDLPAHQKKWIKCFDEPWSRRVQLAPRCHGKSTIWTVIFSQTFLLLNPGARILVVSKTEQLASRLLRQVESVCIRLWQAGCAPKLSSATATEMRLEGCDSKEPNVSCSGVLGSLTGGHYDLIVCDDVLDDRNTQTPQAREEVEEWFYGSLLQLCLPETRLLVVGTRKHPEDLYGKLGKNPAWEFISEKAIIRWPSNFTEALEKGMPISGFFSFGDKGQLLGVKKEGKWQVLWPKMWGVDRLLLDRLMTGQAMFDREKQNDVSFYLGRTFRREWLLFYDLLPERPSLSVYTACDLAISEREGSDWFAMVTIGVDSAGTIYLLDCIRGHFGFSRQAEAVRDSCELHRPLLLGIEDVAYQRALIEHLSGNLAVPVKPITPLAPKQSRIRALQPLFESGKVRVAPCHELFIRELLEFPGGEHDDMIDAFEMAVSLARQGTSPRVDILEVL